MSLGEMVTPAHPYQMMKEHLGMEQKQILASHLVVELSIVVKDTGVAINLLSFLRQTVKKNSPSSVYLLKLNMNFKTWEEPEDLKDATISLEIDGYLYQEFHNIAHRLLEGDHKQEEDKNDKIVVSKVKSDWFEFNGMTDESHLLNLPFDVLKMVMEFSVCIEYMNFHASCKLHHLAAPTIQWSNQTVSKRLQLQAYSLISPWLMVIGKHTIYLIYPMFGDKYFIKTPPELELIGGLRIHCSRYGWLLMRRESLWREYALNFGNDDPYLYRIPAFYGGDVYTLSNGK
nr:hypothetical protein [Tanacetum cinerariifolium]